MTDAPDAAGTTPSLSIDGPVATITLQRPSLANRLDPDDLATIVAHCDTLQQRFADVRAVVVTGSGRHFSAGYDLGALGSSVDRDPLAGDAAADAGDRPSARLFSSMVDRVEALPQVTICAVNGGVFGGSTELALGCDFRIGTPQTRLRMPAARLGLHYPLGGLVRYVARLGLQTTKRLFLLADEHDASALLAMGFLDAVVPREALADEAHAWAMKVVATAPLASAGMKATLDALGRGDVDPARVAALETRCERSDDLREGIAAWREKRTPRFVGR